MVACPGQFCLDAASFDEVTIVLRRGRKPKVKAQFRVYTDGTYVQGDNMDLQMFVGDVKAWRVVGKTAAGAPAALDTKDIDPIPSNSNAGAVDMSIGADKLSGNFTALSPGVAAITYDVDADLDPGETRIIRASINITVKAVEAATAEFEVV